jgi:hypothetical protein
MSASPYFYCSAAFVMPLVEASSSHQLHRRHNNRLQRLNATRVAASLHPFRPRQFSAMARSECAALATFSDSFLFRLVPTAYVIEDANCADAPN